MPHTGQVPGGRPAVGNVPVDLERIRKRVPQEAEPGDLDRVAVAIRLDVDNLHLEQVARLGTFHIHRPGERVHHVQVRRGHNVQARGRAHLPVERVARLQDDLVARLAADHRRDVRMPAVVPCVRLLQQRLVPVDTDLLRCHAASRRRHLAIVAPAVLPGQGPGSSRRSVVIGATCISS